MFLRIKFPTSITGLWPAIIVMVAFTKSSQKNSTHLLTVLIMSVILHIAQRKRNKKRVPNPELKMLITLRSNPKVLD